MPNYSKSKIYCIRHADTNEIVLIGGTISCLKRRYWNHKCNANDGFYKTIHERNLDWNKLKIEKITDFSRCRDRRTLTFAAEVVSTYHALDNPQILQDLLNNIDFYIDSNI
jgi:hypothetical protein